MTSDENATDELLRRAVIGDAEALADLFGRYRERLRLMIRLRLDRRLYGRLDPSDVLQETYLDLAKRFPEYAAKPTLPFFLWLRWLTGQKLIDLHRRHLGTKIRERRPPCPNRVPSATRWRTWLRSLSRALATASGRH